MLGRNGFSCSLILRTVYANIALCCGPSFTVCVSAIRTLSQKSGSANTSANGTARFRRPSSTLSILVYSARSDGSSFRIEIPIFRSDYAPSLPKISQFLCPPLSNRVCYFQAIGNSPTCLAERFHRSNKRSNYSQRGRKGVKHSVPTAAPALPNAVAMPYPMPRMAVWKDSDEISPIVAPGPM